MTAQPDEKISALAARLSAAGATVRRGADGGPVIEMRADARPRAAVQDDGNGSLGSNSAGQLKAFIERIERLEEEKAGISDDIKEVYGEAKGTGFDAKIIRKIVRLRKQDPAERAAESEILETYMHALGME